MSWLRHPVISAWVLLLSVSAAVAGFLRPRVWAVSLGTPSTRGARSSWTDRTLREQLMAIAATAAAVVVALMLLRGVVLLAVLAAHLTVSLADAL